MFDWISDPHSWVALSTLIAIEIVLGIDNIIFISILVAKLPPEQQNKARQLGLAMAMFMRIGLLFSIVWIMQLVEPWFSILQHEISGRDIILIGGGLFLLAKSTHEIHTSLEIVPEQGAPAKIASFFSVVTQIAILDIVFSIDSVITAVGLAEHLSIMVIAIVISVMVMLFSAKSIGTFVDNNPTIKMLALSFLMMIGLALIAEGFDVHIPKGYIYFAMAFSVFVEILNMRVRKKNNSSAASLNKKVV